MALEKQPPAVEEKAAPKVSRSEDPDEDDDAEVVEEPVKRQAKKAEPSPKAKANLADVVSQWGASS